MLKSWNEMRKIDVTPYCERRDEIRYLNWAMCVKLLHDNGAEKVYWDVIPNERTGNSLRESETVFTDKNKVTNKCYETRIRIVIDDYVFEMQTPVLNGVNPVKDNSMSQLRVWNSMCRAFVKGVAIHTGLGFDLWLKEEYNELANDIPMMLDNQVDDAKISTLKQICASHGVDINQWLQKVNRTWKTLTNAEAAAMLNALKEKYGDE